MKYSLERKDAVLKKMLPPHNRPIAALAEEEGISTATLYLWRTQARAQGHLLPDGATGPEGWRGREKLAAVMETARLNEAERAEYCRKRGLYPEQIMAWRTACEQATEGEAARSRTIRELTQADKRRIKDLERELARKEKALAETAALLTLRKKAQAIWGDGEDA
jgi:transposase-like protein